MAALLAIGIVAGLVYLSVLSSDALGIVEPLWKVVVVCMLFSVACGGAVSLIAWVLVDEDLPRRRQVAAVFRICVGVGALVWLALNL